MRGALQMAIYLLDNTLKVEIIYEKTEWNYEDNICVCIIEECPEDEKIFRYDETNMYLTAEQARRLARLLDAAVEAGREDWSR
jgi:hypothetical protein